MEINIKIQPKAEMRYDTVGDYWDENGITNIRVADLGDDDMNFCVAMHELVEQYLCKKRGIKEEDIIAFDIEFEANRAEDDDSEPGDAIDAPYQMEHFFATTIERLVSAELGVDWKYYDYKVMNL